YTWSVEFRQLVFDGLQTLGTYQKQALQAESDRAALRQSELETTASVQQYFISYLCAVENVASQKEAAARLRDQLEITSAYHDVGLRPRLDVLQAQVDLGTSERELITQENTLQTAQAKLNTLLGLAATDSVAYQGVLTEPKFTLTLDECLERAYRLRPDLYVGYKAVEMAVKDRLIARSGYYPQIEAYYNITNSGNTLDLQRAGDNSSRSTTWEVGAQLSWDVFQWGTTYFSDQQAGWLVAKARNAARQLMLDAGYDVKEKFLALREAGKRIQVARQSVAQAREAYDAALAQYREQVGTNFDVLDASSKLLTAEVELTQARGDYLTALSSLYTAIGEYHPELL
ncbi:MAG: TolC family protein, partial [Desulfovibrionaceae bacterium]|nr:TolC family protein [Desulfovibrionaceae bacterium]